MKKNTKHSRFLLMLCALICSFSIGLVGCTAPQSSEPNSSSQKESIQSSKSSESVEESTLPFESEEESEEIESEEPESEEESEEPEEQMLFIVAPTEEVYPYIQDVRDYLKAGPGANVSDYYHPVATQAAPVKIEWRYYAEGAKKFVIEYATKQDFSDALSVEASAAKRAVDIYNLYKL